MKLDSYIKRTEELAELAKANGESPVGCLLVSQETIIGEASERVKSAGDLTAHAEIEAIRNALNIYPHLIRGSTLITTHEPCVMCAYAIRYYGIGTVVFKKSVEHLGSVTSSFKILASDEVPKSWGPPPKIIHLKK